jgi:hypothetical protein
MTIARTLEGDVRRDRVEHNVEAVYISDRPVKIIYGRYDPLGV